MSRFKSKGKAATRSSSQAEAVETVMGTTLLGVHANEKALSKVRNLVADRTNEHGATALKPAAHGKRLRGFFPIFQHCLAAGLVPPFSPFLEAVLAYYQVQLLHLHPNSVLILAIFAYLCEAYLGLKPTVGLFRCFYALRNTAKNERSGCVSFHIVDGMGGVYIPMSRSEDKAITSVTKKVDDFRQKWFFVGVERPCAFLEVPDEPPVKNSHWGKAAFDGAKNVSLMGRLSFLGEEGLTGQMIVADFVSRRIAPLQAHSVPMWMYSWPNDKMGLHVEDNDKDTVDNILSALFVSPSVLPVDELRAALRPLHQYHLTERMALLKGMHPFTPTGPADSDVPMPAPRGAEGADSLSASGAGLGEEEATAWEVSSSRARPFTDEICDTSSGDEDAFVVAPSRLVEEEAEEGEASGAEAFQGRCGPRTKVAVDYSVARPSDVPSKRKAEAPPARPTSKPFPSWRSPGLAWVDAGAPPPG